MSKIYSFQEQLNLASSYEGKALDLLSLIDYFKTVKHVATKHTVADGLVLDKYEWIEVKVDFTDFPNHFIEQFSSHEQKTSGGPWQYKEKGVRFYLFYYVKNEELYLFDTESLINKIKDLRIKNIISVEKNYRLVNQKGGNYQTGGWKINKKDLDSICLAIYKKEKWNINF